MGRQARDNRPNIKPVERIELSEKHIKLRFVIMIVLLLVGVSLLVNGLMRSINGQKGVHEIEVNTAAGLNCGSEFIFRYDLGVDNSATAENKALTELYTSLSVKAFSMFSTLEYEEPVSLGYINRHPNANIVVDPVLYNAFSLLKEHEDRHIYLGPVLESYDCLFYTQSECDALNYDPYASEDIALIYEEAASFARDEAAVDIKLLGDNTICLEVSDEYLSYAKENEFHNFLDFGYMKNAFVIDYISSELISKGFTRGELVSFDGFAVNLGKYGENYSIELFNREDSLIKSGNRLNLTGYNTFVSLRDYPVSELDKAHYLEKEDGTIRNYYVSLKDGKCKASIHELYAYSDSKSASEMLLLLTPVYVEGEFDAEYVKSLKAKNINPLYFKGGEVVE